MSVLIAMSGGVDSSVSAFLIREKYKTCKGATMILHGNSCDDARKICDNLGIQHEIIDYSREFAEIVINDFVRIYESGGTPNPCITCNKFMKFGLMLDYARKSGLERIATGHYARITRESSGRYLLSKGKDLERDQSYVLYMLTQEKLASIDFPLGDMTKPEVRELAESLNFVNARKHDSQDICFVSDNDYAGFIKNFTGKIYKSGNFIDESGRIIGTHKGIINYTIGQRRGLGVAAKSRLYVANIDIDSNNIMLAEEDSKVLQARGVIASNANLIALDEVKNFHARVKLRYRQKEIPAVINQENNKLIIEFAESQQVPAIGQAAVIYDGDIVIGGGTISQIIHS
ncbi:MAG: tRNA 2-thiouridine(34) synthase MnmA [Synergistaceae bacterium]|nr:tRNA 2-thiouridine(34) synthase MnmA [Synergistaceae bacterium]